MNKKYKYISFEILEELPKTYRWVCLNNKTKVFLGRVEWYSSWRCYVFYPEHDVLFNEDCLLDIADFLDIVMKEREV